MSDDVIALETTVESGDSALAWGPGADAGDGPFPLVVIVHGSHMHPKHYAEYAKGLAREGFVSIAPEHVREVFGDTAHYPQQAFVNWGLNWARAENEREGSPFAGRIDTTTMFITGHSMGGGVVLGVASDFGQPGLVVDEWSRPKELVAAVVNGTHNIPPPRTGDPLPIDNQIPLAFFIGTADTVVTADQVGRTFDVVHGVKPHLKVVLDGGNHFFISNTDNPEGANPDKSPMMLDQEASVAATAKWTALWFKATAGDADAQAALAAGAGNDEPYVDVTFISN
jgi:dienelactone hydrolase